MHLAREIMKGVARNRKHTKQIPANNKQPEEPPASARELGEVPLIVNPYDYRISKYPELLQAMTSTEPNVLFVGPWGSGKTRLLAEKAYFLCCKYPNYKAALVRRELKHLRRTTWKWLTEMVIPSKVLNNYAHYNKQEMEIKFPNGSEIQGCGLDDPQKLASTEYGFIGIEEAIEITEQDKFVWIEGRNRQPNASFHQVMYACNAGPPAHYLYQRFYMRKLGLVTDGDRLVEGKTLWDILPASYKARMDMLKGRYRDRFILNKWIGYEGLVYDVFDPTSIVSRFNIPDDWEYVATVDFGFHNPFVFQAWALSPDAVWFLDRELYMTGRTINTLVPEISLIMEECNLVETDNNKGRPLHPLATYADHDAEDRATLDEAGISSIPATKEVGPGIQTVYNAMAEGRVKFFADALREKDPILESRGKPTCTVDEIQGYTWADKAKEEPRKVDDHGVDGMRYGIHSHTNSCPPGLFMIRRNR